MHSADKGECLYGQIIVRYEIKIVGMIYIFCMFTCDKKILEKCISCIFIVNAFHVCVIKIVYQKVLIWRDLWLPYITNDKLSNNMEYHYLKTCISLLIHSKKSYNSPAVSFDEYSL